VRALYRRLLRFVAFRTGRGVARWQAACHPSGEEWAAWLKIHGGFQGMGKDCSIQCNVVISDPAYVRIGNNVRMSGCTLFGHDGSVNMLNSAFGLTLDRVGKIDIGDNVFIGHNATIMPDVIIGSNVVIAAGSMVVGDVEPNSVYCGVPAKRIGAIGDLVDRLQQRNKEYPWAPLIAKRAGAFDAAMEPALVSMRVKYFYG